MTVSNHVSAVDDPGTIAAMLPGSWLLQPKVSVGRVARRPLPLGCC